MKLILFFNGWGMDKKVVENVVVPDGYEIEVINFPYSVNINLDRYDEIVPIGWSFGCYYLTKWISSYGNSKINKIIAINGNGEIIGKYGITPKIFDFTLNTLTPDSLLKFYNNMGIDENFKNPNRSFQEVKKELEFFKENYTPLKNIFTNIVIGKNDKIVSGNRQIKYCQEKSIPYTELDMGHYPFDNIRTWSELYEL